ncbi:MAG TPA: phosphatidate cytidylyltransferase [Bryobacteraceae bacterium]|nr:phosphatidate cytidylyltransferase [Bryobacteraceae bacterium]
MKRVLTALVLVPFALLAIYWAPQPVFVAIAITIALLCYREFAGLTVAHGYESPGPLGYAAGLAMFFFPSEIRVVALLLLAGAMAVRTLASFLPTAACSVLGVIYIFGAWRCAVDLRAISPHWILFALAINWVGDVAAFYVGKAIGRHRLAPRVSPAKSWEGAAASLLAAVAFGLVFRRLASIAIPVLPMLALSVVANIAGQLGDLAESAMKRGAGVKDSGAFLPGHGGWLDRLDSSLFTLPAISGLLPYLIR